MTPTLSSSRSRSRPTSGSSAVSISFAHNLVLLAPGLGVLRKFGTIAASPENAHQVLSSGAVLLVYPGGDIEVHRPSLRSVQGGFRRPTGFLAAGAGRKRATGAGRQRRRSGGAQALFLSRGEWLAKFLGLDRLARLKVLPISLALPWGVNVGDFLGHIPLPAKITVDVLEPIDLRAEYGEHPDLDVAYKDVVGRMQAALDDLAAERRLPVIG